MPTLDKIRHSRAVKRRLAGELSSSKKRKIGYSGKIIGILKYNKKTGEIIRKNNISESERE